MKSFKQYLTEARPKGDKRYDRDTSKLEARLDRMYAAGGSQKNIDRAEMRLARRTNEGDYDIDDQRLVTTKERPDLPLEDSPRSQSVEELMRGIASKIYTHGHTEEMVGDEIRSAMHDFAGPHLVQPGISNAEVGAEAHKMFVQHQQLINKIKSKKK
jgi:hypothetical protein